MNRWTALLLWSPALLAVLYFAGWGAVVAHQTHHDYIAGVCCVAFGMNLQIGFDWLERLFGRSGRAT